MRALLKSPRIRRHRHPRVQCRHRLGGADRGDDARAWNGTWISWPRGTSWLARCVQDEARRKSAAPSSSSDRRMGLPRRPAPRPTARPRQRRFISHAASPWRARTAGIRVNVVNPDAVLRGSNIWQGEWRAQRAAAYNTHGRARSGLSRPLDAEAQRVSGGYRGGGHVLRVRTVLEVHGEHPQRRRRERAGVHKMSVLLPRGGEVGDD